MEDLIRSHWKKVVGGLVALLLLVAFFPLRTVPTGYRGVVTIGGSIRGIQPEGFTLLWPWERLDNFSIRAEQADIKGADGATSDTQPVVTSLTVRYSILPDKVAHVFEQYSHDGNLNSFVTTAAMETFKAVTARYNATDLIAKRPQVSNDIASLLKVKLAQYGAQVINIDMTNFSFSQSYMEAINAKVTEEQRRLAADNKLRTVESEQKQKVAVAEAEAHALKAKADGEAYAVKAAAEAEAIAVRVKGTAQADAMRAQANALTANPLLVDMKKAETWDGKLPQAIYAGAPIPFMNLGK
jgi:prohibitin 2